jgi:hypothetical protein
MHIDPKDKKRKLLTNVHGIRRELYLQANKADKPIRIPCGDATTAQKFRFGLYAAGRVAKGNPELDPTFLEAVENVIATVEGGDVVLTRSELTTEGLVLASALAALGVQARGEGPRAVAERLAVERVEARIGGHGATPPPPTPRPTAPTPLDVHFNGTTPADLAGLFDNLVTRTNETRTNEGATDDREGFPVEPSPVHVHNPYPRRN